MVLKHVFVQVQCFKYSFIVDINQLHILPLDCRLQQARTVTLNLICRFAIVLELPAFFKKLSVAHTHSFEFDAVFIVIDLDN